MSYCIKSLKSGRCVKSKYEDASSYNCNYNYSTKRCNSTKKKSVSLLKPKPFSIPKTFVKSKRKTLKSRTIKIETPKSTNIVNYYGYLVEANVKTYLEASFKKISGKKIRDMNSKYELYLPVDEYPNDNELKTYIIKDLLFLSSNDARDRTKTNAITLNNVHYVIINDIALLVLFGSKFKGFFKLKGNDVIVNHDKVREHMIELDKPYKKYNNNISNY